MIQPALKGEALLADIRTANRNDHHFRLWWLGQSGFLLQWKGEHLLFDPYLSDSLTRKYANTDKPHVRMTELVVDPARLTFIDVCTSSHNHTDHLDAETLNALRSANPGMKFVIPEANREFVAGRLSCDPAWPIGLNDGESVEAGAFTISAVPAAHEQVDRDGKGRCKYLGYVAKLGPWTVYQAGDTMLYDGIVKRLRPFRIDVALLPITNGAGKASRGQSQCRGSSLARQTDRREASNPNALRYVRVQYRSGGEFRRIHQAGGCSL